uniref:alpha/beta fold hydrolase n=1 Tax=Ningiella ruwaisensis TaxID=2364274 RepID=UPI0010A06327|nr:alpha/beta fold hydrolase [Ningiella ruwaisensis]
MIVRLLFALSIILICQFAYSQNASSTSTQTAPDLSSIDEKQIELTWPIPEPVDFVCPFKNSIDYEPGEISCGFITVPENREDPDTRMIRLHFVKIAATGEEEEYRSDPVIYLTGGPGVGVNTYVKRLKDHDLLKQRDLYILEHRGIGASGNFCPFYGAYQRDLVHAKDLEEAQRNAADVTRNCFEAARDAGVDLSAYNTVENARDVQALRQALGFEKWNVWGISYGSHLGQMLVLQDPEGIQALVIDAIVPNDLTDLMRIGRWVNLVLENMFATCADTDVCEGLEQRFDAVLDKMRGKPVRVTLEDTELFPQKEMLVDASVLPYAVFMMAYEQDSHPAMPAVLQSLVKYFETDNQNFYKVFAESMGETDGISVSQGMSQAIRCNDGYTHASANVIKEDLAENPRFANMIRTETGAKYAANMCEESGLAPRDRSDYRFVETDIPTLIVNGSWDPVTPAVLARYIAPGFSNGRYIEVPYAGHGPTRSMSECAGPVLNAFFDNPNPNNVDASCLEKGVGVPDYLEFVPTPAPILFASLASDAPKSFLIPGLWFGLPTLVLLLSLVLLPANFVLRRFASESIAEPVYLKRLRLIGFLTTVSGLGFIALVAFGLYAASEVSEIAVIAGLHPYAWLAPWLAILTGLFGLYEIYDIAQHRMAGKRRPRRSQLGLCLVGIAGLALSLFAIVYDLSVF